MTLLLLAFGLLALPAPASALEGTRCIILENDPGVHWYWNADECRHSGPGGTSQTCLRFSASDPTATTVDPQPCLFWQESSR